jgi:hypothetical protein
MLAINDRHLSRAHRRKEKGEEILETKTPFSFLM